MKPSSILTSIAMLKEVVAGKTYDAVAAGHGVSRTAVERRIKALALKVSREVGIDGLNEDALACVQRLRNSHIAVMAALERYAPNASRDRCAGRILTDDEIALAVQRTRTRSTCPQRDVALLYLLLSTGARPLEIDRLEVRDYLHADGSVRAESVMRAEVAVNRKARPLFFASKKTRESIDAYLAGRVRQDSNSEVACAYRGFDPHGRLFLTETGAPFEIAIDIAPGRRRCLCRSILDTFRKMFRRIGLNGLSALHMRRTVAARLLARGATEDQIGEILSISALKSVRELLPGERPALQLVARELV